MGFEARPEAAAENICYETRHNFFLMCCLCPQRPGYMRPSNGDPPDCNDAFDDSRMASLLNHMSNTENEAKAEQNESVYGSEGEAVLQLQKEFLALRVFLHLTATGQFYGLFKRDVIEKVERRSWIAHIVVPHTAPADDEFHFTEFTIYHRNIERPTFALYFYLSDKRVSDQDQNHWGFNMGEWTKNRRIDVLIGYIGSNGRILEQMAKHHTPLSTKPCSLHMRFACDDGPRTSGNGQKYTNKASKFVTLFFGTPDTRVKHSTDGRSVIDGAGNKSPLPTDTEWQLAQKHSLQKWGLTRKWLGVLPIPKDMESTFTDPKELPNWSRTSGTSGSGGKRW